MFTVSTSLQPLLFVTVTIYWVLTVGDTVCDAPDPNPLFHWYVLPPVAVNVTLLLHEIISLPAFAIGDELKLASIVPKPIAS